MLTKKIEEIKAKAISEIKKTADERALFDVKVAYLGRKGKLTEILKNLKNLPKLKLKCQETTPVFQSVMFAMNIIIK